MRNEKLFHHFKRCVPTALQNGWVREYHSRVGHMGSEKLWVYVQKHMEWGDLNHARDACLDVMKECHVCQACQRPLRLRSTMDFSPIPPVPMSSVAIDLFRLPLVVHEGKNFDTMAVCFCRHSGWLIAVPCLDKGLTGAKWVK